MMPDWSGFVHASPATRKLFFFLEIGQQLQKALFTQFHKRDTILQDLKLHRLANRVITLPSLHQVHTFHVSASSHILFRTKLHKYTSTTISNSYNILFELDNLILVILNVSDKNFSVIKQLLQSRPKKGEMKEKTKEAYQMEAISSK